METQQMILLEQLFNSYFSHLVIYSQKITGNRETSEDLVQDLFLRLLENKYLQNITPSYLFICAKNASLNYLKSPLKKYIPLDPRQEQIQDNDTSEAIAHMNRLEKLDAAINALPPKCKEIFIQVYLHKQSYEDIASQLNISYHTVKAHMNKAFLLIRKQVILLFIIFRDVKIQFHQK